MDKPEENHVTDAARFFLKDPNFEFTHADEHAPIEDSLEKLAQLYTLGQMIGNLFSAVQTIHTHMAIHIREFAGGRPTQVIGPFAFRFEPLAVVCSVKGREHYDLPPEVINKVWEMRAHARGVRQAQQFVERFLDGGSLIN